MPMPLSSDKPRDAAQPSDPVSETREDPKKITKPRSPPITQTHMNHSPTISPITNNTQPSAQQEPVSSTFPNPVPDNQPNIMHKNPNPSSSLSKPPTENPQPTNQHPMRTRLKANIRKPTSKLNLSVTLASTISPEPHTITQALKDKRWRGAMCHEMDAFAQNQIFDLVPRPPNRNIIGCRWLLPTGSLGRCKARLVTKWYNQEYGRDYTATFSPVIKSTTIHLILDIAVSRSWPIQQLDVNNAFLQGTLNEEVYMEQPPSFVDSDNPTHVCRLRKAVYRLKQAPRAWYLELITYLLSIGFRNSQADASMFVLHRGNHYTYLLVYVDDILITGSNTPFIQHVLSLLVERFSVKDPEDLNYFFGLEAHRTSQGMHLSQRKYVVDLVHKYHMSDAKPVTTPMASSPKLTINSGASLSDPSDYRRLVRSLQNISFTRPDIAFAVNRLSQFMHHPTEDHWQAAKRILRYMVGTTTHVIYLPANNSTQLHAYSDADSAGDSDATSPPTLTSYTLVELRSPGPQRSRQASHAHPLKLSTDPLPTPSLKFDGSATF